MQIKQTRWNITATKRNTSLLPATALYRNERETKRTDRVEKEKGQRTALFSTTAIMGISHPEQISLFFFTSPFPLFPISSFPSLYIFLFSPAFYYIKDLPLPLSLNLLLFGVCVMGW
jgi:hypothetical protein